MMTCRAFAQTSLLTWLVFVTTILDAHSQQKPEPKKPPPHPWLGIAPGEYVRLIDKGKVSIAANDKLLEQWGKIGLTQFRVHLEYKCSIDLLSTRSLEGANLVRIRAKFTKRELQYEHTISIASHIDPPHPWQHPLIKHEMDHVAITTDPRIQTLVDGLFTKPVDIEFEPQSNRRPTNQEINQEVDVHVRQVVAEFEELLQKQYDWLDEVSKNGQTDIEQRSEFFSELYSWELLSQRNPRLLTRFTKDEWTRRTKIPKNKLESHYLIKL